MCSPKSVHVALCVHVFIECANKYGENMKHMRLCLQDMHPLMLMKSLPSENKWPLPTEVPGIGEITGIFVLTLGETESLTFLS